MPELVEVERARALIEERVVGRVVAGADDSDTWVCRPHAPGEIAAAVTGFAVGAALRRGKAMWLELDGGPELGIHLGMAGKIVVDEPLSDRGWDRFVLFFEDGGSLALRDKRRLGRAVLDPDLSRVGPDAEEISREEFRVRVRRGSGPLKARLMDQSVVAGVGNLLADETLWKAGLSPLRTASSLSDSEVDGLRRALRAATRRATRLGGVHTGELIPARRREVGICPRCGADLVRDKVGGRTTWWCPVEQT
jgi:formamidopyrimidine-DNA glycosylase